MQDARAFCVAFFDACDHEHQHAALGLHTPASVYYGTASEIRVHRPLVHQAYAAHPARFARAADTAEAAHRRLDQPTNPGGAHTDEITAVATLISERDGLLSAAPSCKVMDPTTQLLSLGRGSRSPSFKSA